MLEHIPIDMKTILNNLLAIKKKNSEINSYKLTYNSHLIPSKTPSYYSTCNVNIQLVDNTIYEFEHTGDTFSNKKNAERYVAYICYNKIVDILGEIVPKGHVALNISDIISDEDEVVYSSSEMCMDLKQQYPLLPVIQPQKHHTSFLYVLADIENKPNTKNIDEIIQQFENTIILKFISNNHHNRSNGNIIVNSGYKDAADHAISMYTGGIIQSVSIPVDIIIYTGDRFAGALQELCQFEHARVYYMAHSSDIIDHISKYSITTLSNGNKCIY